MSKTEAYGLAMMARLRLIEADVLMRASRRKEWTPEVEDAIEAVSHTLARLDELLRPDGKQGE